MSKRTITDPIYPISSRERLVAINNSQSLPEQHLGEILFNSSFDYHQQLFPFLPPVYRGAYPLTTIHPPVFREQYILEYIESFPLSLNVISISIDTSRSTLWIKSYEPNLIGTGVFVGRHIFFHTGNPFTSLDTVKDTGNPFQAFPGNRRGGTTITSGAPTYYNPKIVHNSTPQK